jgi:hypothetical protein
VKVSPDKMIKIPKNNDSQQIESMLFFGKIVLLYGRMWQIEKYRESRIILSIITTKAKGE